MVIEHLCLNVKDIEKEKAFYCTYFGFVANEKYHNSASGWENYFLSSPGGGTRLELLHHRSVSAHEKPAFASGLIHFAISLGGGKEVEGLTARLREAGFRIVSDPRTTGDGYFESSFLDPEGNLVELTT